MTDWRFLFEKWVLQKHKPPPLYERNVNKALRRIHGDLFVDVGANEGAYCKLLSGNFKTIYAIEPNLAFQSELPPNVIRLNVAFSNENGESDLVLNTGTGAADTLLHEFDYKPDKDPYMITKKVYSTERRIRVKTVTYDTFISGRIADLVKIDVEGAEFLVLQGMNESLSRGMVKNIMVELHNIERQEELLKLLMRHRYKVTKLDLHPRFLGKLAQ
jgi:FkbM family methyltransferase